MEGSSTINMRRMQGHSGFALIAILFELAGTGGRFVSRQLAEFAAARRQAQARSELSRLSDHALKDIGLDRGEIDGLFR